MACACLLAPRLAAADAAQRWPEPGRLTMEAATTYTQDDRAASSITLLSPQLAAHYRWSERWSVAFDWGTALLWSSPDHGDTDFVTAAGNPALSVYAHWRSQDWRWRVGSGVTVPVADVHAGPRGRLDAAAYNWAANARGLWNLWLWAPERTAVLVPLQLEHVGWKHGWLRLEATPFATFPVRAFEDDVDTFVQAAATGLLREGPLELGVRTFGVWMFANPQDRLQVVVEPLLRLAFARGFLEARYTIPVGEPLGHRRGLDVWGAHLGAGWTL